LPIGKSSANPSLTGAYLPESGAALADDALQISRFTPDKQLLHAPKLWFWTYQVDAYYD
jgi:hypothetical protein